MGPEPNALARGLFAGLAPGYDRWAEVLALFQYRRWHASLLAALAPRPGEYVLDVSTGSGAVAFDLADRGCRVVGLDLSREMLGEARRRAASSAQWAGVRFVEGRAEQLPFPAGTFDAVTFTFLLRYVADPTAPLREMGRVLRPGGRVAMLEFGVPPCGPVRRLWSLYVYTLLPALARPVSPAWARVGAFLGDSIAAFDRRYPPEKLAQDWRGAGFDGLRWRRLSLGGAIVVTGARV